MEKLESTTKVDKVTVITRLVHNKETDKKETVLIGAFTNKSKASKVYASSMKEYGANTVKTEEVELNIPLGQWLKETGLIQ